MDHNNKVDEIIDALLDKKYNWIRVIFNRGDSPIYHISNGIASGHTLCPSLLMGSYDIRTYPRCVYGLAHPTICSICLDLIKLNPERYGFYYDKSKEAYCDLG